MTTSSEETGTAVLATLLMIVVFALVWFHVAMPHARNKCDNGARAAGFSEGWLNGVMDCMVSVDGGRTWVQVRVPR